VCEEVLPHLQPGRDMRRDRHVGQERRVCRERSRGVLDAHHVAVPKQALKREFPEGVVRTQEGWVRYDPRLALTPPDLPPERWREACRTLDDLLMDPRNGVLVRRYHHDALEGRRLVIPRALLPLDAEEFVAELGLGWYVDKMQRRA
jgi:hypothetical protein